MRISRAIRVLTIFMAGFPLWFPAVATLLFELGGKGLASIVLSPLYYIGSVFWVFSGMGLRTLKHWAWYTFCIAQVITAYFTALILVNYSESDFKGLAFVLVVLSLYLVLRGVAREIRVPYLFPRINWWESGIAGIHHLSVHLSATEGGVPAGKGQLLDLSSRGCFIKTPVDYRLGDPILIRLDAYGQEAIVPGRIVWNAKSSVTHPKGIGIQFAEPDRALRRKLKVFVRYFNQEKNASHGTPVLPS